MGGDNVAFRDMEAGGLRVGARVEGVSSTDSDASGTVESRSGVRIMARGM